MVERISSGIYELVDTVQDGRVLYLDGVPYAWTHTGRLGTIRAIYRKILKADTYLKSGVYRLFAVYHDAKFTAAQHLELSVDSRHWQGYLLPTGLPIYQNHRKIIIPTDELVTDEHVSERAFGWGRFMRLTPDAINILNQKIFLPSQR